MTQNVGVRAEKVRDLRKQVAELAPEDEPEILFQSISPGRQPVTVYSIQDGEPIAVPAYMIGAVMEKTLADGRFMFTAEKKDAPEYKPGNVKCFLHPDSPERAILEEIGLSAATCPADQLGSLHSKRQHGLHRHKQEWAAYQEFVEDAKEEKREARQERQLEATLALARGDTPTAQGVCDVCGKDGLKNVGAHKRGAHK
ncbi:hypothetical protein LCGC14_1477440 [marine sediment metagenome]|uniref:Uncharacterized protein n=1 Tax=marine sediment metagenome TaxID=412755 RepID=A0A0F9JBA7_9ZZZZ